MRFKDGQVELSTAWVNRRRGASRIREDGRDTWFEALKASYQTEAKAQEAETQHDFEGEETAPRHQSVDDVYPRHAEKEAVTCPSTSTGGGTLTGNRGRPTD
jgi:hypothetical protein